MRIGLNALYLIPGGVGGTEIYARNLVRHLAAAGSQHELVIFSNREAEGSWGPLPANVRVEACPVSARSRPARILWEQLALPRRARALGVDVLHSLGYTAPLHVGCANLVTLHDLNYHFHPEDWSTSGLWANRLLIPPVARRATRVVTISECSRRAIRDVLGVPDERIDVVYHGVDGNLVEIDDLAAARERHALGLEGEYLLSVTASHPHKNLDGLLGAYRRYAEAAHRPLPLVIVGIAGRDQARVEEAARANRSGRVILTGWIESPTLSALYRGARAFVFTSRYEGFGFPVLEAMSVGVPVISSNAASLPELTGDAALSCDPDDIPGFAAAIGRVLDEPTLRADLVARGRARAEGFRWEQAARATLEAYERALRQFGR